MNLNINKIVSAALRKAKELRTIPPCTCNQRRLNIPMGQGVYLFYKGDKIIYVGQGGSLKKRISLELIRLDLIIVLIDNKKRCATLKHYLDIL